MPRASHVLHSTVSRSHWAVNRMSSTEVLAEQSVSGDRASCLRLPPACSSRPRTTRRRLQRKRALSQLRLLTNGIWHPYCDVPESFAGSGVVAHMPPGLERLASKVDEIGDLMLSSHLAGAHDATLRAPPGLDAVQDDAFHVFSPPALSLLKTWVQAAFLGWQTIVLELRLSMKDDGQSENKSSIPSGSLAEKAGEVVQTCSKVEEICEIKVPSSHLGAASASHVVSSIPTVPPAAKEGEAAQAISKVVEISESSLAAMASNYVWTVPSTGIRKAASCTPVELQQYLLRIKAALVSRGPLHYCECCEVLALPYHYTCRLLDRAAKMQFISCDDNIVTEARFSQSLM